MITTDQKSTVERFPGADGREVLLNVSPQFVLLRVPTKTELEQLLTEFRERQRQWFATILVSTDRGHWHTDNHKVSPRPDGAPAIWALLGNVRRPSRSRPERSLRLRHLRNDAIPENAWAALEDIPRPPTDYISMSILVADRETQEAFVGLAMGETFSDLIKMLRPRFARNLNFPEMEDSLSSTTDTVAYLEFLTTVGASINNSLVCRAAGIRLFLYFLCQRQIMLAPLVGGCNVGDVRRGLPFFRSAETNAMIGSIEGAHDNAHWSKGWHRALQRSLVLLTTASTWRTREDLSTHLFDRIDVITRVIPHKMTSLRSHLGAIHQAVHIALGSPPAIPRLTTYRRQPSTDLFPWIRLSTKTASRALFPRLLKGEYDAQPHIATWGDAFSKHIAHLQIKSTDPSELAANAFLVWMIETKRTISSIKELQRADINDYRRESDCLRSWLDSHVGTTRRSMLLGQLRRLFEMCIAEECPNTPNPVDLEQDRFLRTHPGKSVRPPFRFELLNYLRELNARGDFALSRDNGKHYRVVVNPETMQRERQWFPAYAILIDLLLRIPIRSSDARFLDSGEGDDFLVDVHAPTLPHYQNPSGLRRKHRREGVFYVFETMDRDPATGLMSSSRHLGLYFNMNKSLANRDASYELPYCEDAIRDNLVKMIKWQQDFNPVREPIPCMERDAYFRVKNELVLANLKTTFPIFRDPAGPGNWPLRRNTLAEYWAELCAAAEDELRAKGHRIKLTEWKTDPGDDIDGSNTDSAVAISDTGNGATSGRKLKRWYLYDLHTTRVVGITALINAGLPINFVQQMVGHYSPVMTEYYYKPHEADLNAAIANARRTLERDTEGLPQPAAPDWDRLERFLHARDDNGPLALWGPVGHACRKERQLDAPTDPVRKAFREEIERGTGSYQVFAHGICACGSCDSGGVELPNGSYAAVPRPSACSLCRYRLTGPMFLPGLVVNANRLMHELYEKAQEIAALKETLDKAEDAGENVHKLRVRRTGLLRETDVICEEWATEYRHVKLAERRVKEFIEAFGSTAPENGTGGVTNPAPTLNVLATRMNAAEVTVQLERHHHFVLEQTLVENMLIEPAVHFPAALIHHREFLNELFVAQSRKPFLLGLNDEVRKVLQPLCGNALLRVVPEDRLEDLHKGAASLCDFPALSAFFEEVSRQLEEAIYQAKALGRGIDIATLRTQVHSARGGIDVSQ